MPLIESAAPFAISLAIGLMLGLERERSPVSKAGVRTFALVALLGTASALLAQAYAEAWILAGGLLSLTAMMVAANWQRAKDDEDPGTTTTAALLVCYLLGAMLWHGYTQLAVALALGATALLQFKAELHGIARRLSQQDLLSFLQFAVITLIVLPLVPDKGYGPFAALNPFKIWLMVVLISGVGLVGYIALRLAGERQGTTLVGLLGGLVSSTATTLVYSRQVRAQSTPAHVASVVIQLSNLAVLVRLTVLTAVVAPGALHLFAPVMVVGLIAGAAVTAKAWRTLQMSDAGVPDVSNPVELRAALGFGLLFALMLLASAWLHDRYGAQGIYALAVVSGLTDVDAISLSALGLFKDGQLLAAQACLAMVLAVVVNLGMKLVLVAALGGRELLRRTAPGFVVLAAALTIAASVTL